MPSSRSLSEPDPDQDGPPIDLDPPDAARYIADMTDALAELARGSGFGFLAYLLNLAQAEARRLVEQEP